MCLCNCLAALEPRVLTCVVWRTCGGKKVVVRRALWVMFVVCFQLPRSSATSHCMPPVICGKICNIIKHLLEKYKQCNKVQRPGIQVVLVRNERACGLVI